MRDAVKYYPIGIIHSPLKHASGAPLQSISAKHVEGVVEVFPRYVPGLKDIAGFSHLILIYHLHRSRRASLTVKPYLDTKKRGIFACRAPARPNPIGLSIVKLEKVRGGTIWVRELDIIDDTPLLDIKPYIPQFDCRRRATTGWFRLSYANFHRARADERFTRADFNQRSQSGTPIRNGNECLRVSPSQD
jgi:tRNA-Thr(GGU) m(6)t(6)A37 methyltransferase TsaA